MNRLKKRYLQINYKGQILDLEVLRYNTGNRIAIQAYTKTKEPFDVLTVNIPAYDADFDDTYIFLNTNHVPDIDKVLEKEGMIENTGYRLQSGYCTYPVVRLVKMIDDNVAFDFISDKMLQLDERIIFAKRLIYNDSITGDYLVNKVATADDKGKIRIYFKDLRKVNKYLKAGIL